ncbi:MAG: UDP-N-acetylmuramate--alanine ligase [Maribacter sp.]|jgi:UDP-N-acetylmuramate--alanine ligase
MKIGIIFGGPSREREISFAGGRTVYDNLDKSLFEPVPIFVDSHRNFILLDWQFLYKGTIRDFYPPVDCLPESPNEFQVYIESLELDQFDELIDKIGRKIHLEELPSLIDLAFLALHGEFGEDGQIQGLLESIHVPYTGSGIRACSIGMDKAFQKKMMETGEFNTPEVMVIQREDWLDDSNLDILYTRAVDTIKYPLVIRPANQGSSIGVAIIGDEKGKQGFKEAVDAAFFIETVAGENWNKKSQADKVQFVKDVTDIRSGLGFPLYINETVCYHPEKLLVELEEKLFVEKNEEVILKAFQYEQKVIIEEFIKGKEFSCVVIRQEDGTVTALPPTEIIKGGEVFDYRSKYLPGLSRKVTPIGIPNTDIEAIRAECENLFRYLEFNVYARIDGFIKEDRSIFLNDPNTTSGMLPSSFFFHQAAEIGLNPSQFLTYLIRISLQERIETTLYQTRFNDLLVPLDQNIEQLKKGKGEQRKIAVIMGGYSFERHISVESGRNIFEKLASSDKYDPVPVFLFGSTDNFELYQIPINLLLKDNADDIRDKILTYKKHPIVESIKEECLSLTQKYASTNVVFEPRKLSFESLAEIVDGVFIALHGRPGEDGTIQQYLEKVGLPYNGSGSASSQITINKYETLQLLKKHGFSVAEQYLSDRKAFEEDRHAELNRIEAKFAYPFIAKPVDDGCSSAVKMVKTREQMEAFFETIYRTSEALPEKARKILKLKPKEEFPIKNEVLIEELISRKDAIHFLEVTGGMLTHPTKDGWTYEMFEPSETLAGGEILSLEEKFLAGEGQNITPARFSKDKAMYSKIAEQVKSKLKEAAEILGVKGYCRVDAFVRIFEDGKAETLIIEINSLPGMTPATCIFHQSAINGYQPYQFIDKILEFGFHS